MKNTKKIVKVLQEKVQTSRLANKFLDKESIAKINGPAVIIEAIVQKASLNCGIEMDWCYCGGRGFVFADGDKKIARRELYLAMPQSDLTIKDLLSYESKS